ncbi:MAG TPA: alpha-L-fucosidase, partial [Saprospiraceae bacterium]|nr:alpha-L-fucosidase [Saprospiraceae bacterium]
MRQLSILALHLLLFSVTRLTAQTDTRMQWWLDARFGLFIHWGLYAVPAGEYGGQKNYGEWIMYEAKIPKPEYEKFAPQFNPTQFDADAWVRMAKDAGMKYMVITSKHHDGFSMFDSKVSDYDIADRTPFRRDPMRELADACKKAGIKLCFYHSIMDWHHPNATGVNFPKYRDEYLKPQLRELLTQYGDLGVLWFDGEWIDEWTEPQGKDLYNFVRGIQPNIIVNNRVGKGRNGMQGMNNSEDAAGDFGTPEQEILGEKSGLPWESCMTMNDHWGYNRNDKNFKSAADLIWNLADVTAKGGNYLLNIGPTAEGTFPPECIERLRIIGEWTRRNAKAIYGTKTWGHWQEGENIRYAAGRGGEVYVFVRGLSGNKLTLKKITPQPGSVVGILGDNRPLSWVQTLDGVTIELPGKFKTGAQPVWVFKITGVPANIAASPVIETAQTAPATTGQSRKKNIVFTGTTEVRLSAEPGATIYYTTDGSEPTEKSGTYSKPFRLSKSATVKAVARTPDKMSSETAVQEFTQAQYGIQVETAFSEKYGASGALTLIDGKRGSLTFTDGQWLGFEGNDFVATIDLGEVKKIHSVSASFLRLIPSWIFLP